MSSEGNSTDWSELDAVTVNLILSEQMADIDIIQTITIQFLAVNVLINIENHPYLDMGMVLLECMQKSLCNIYHNKFPIIVLYKYVK